MPTQAEQAREFRTERRGAWRAAKEACANGHPFDQWFIFLKRGPRPSIPIGYVPASSADEAHARAMVRFALPETAFISVRPTTARLVSRPSNRICLLCKLERQTRARRIAAGESSL